MRPAARQSMFRKGRITCSDKVGIQVVEDAVTGRSSGTLIH
jgi:hypothetical protein